MAEYYEWGDGSWYYIDDDGFETSGDAAGNISYQDPGMPGISVEQIDGIVTAAADAIRAARGYPVQTYPPRYSGGAPPPGSVAASVDLSRKGLGTTFNVDMKTILIGGVVAFAFFSGKGRR